MILGIAAIQGTWCGRICVGNRRYRYSGYISVIILEFLAERGSTSNDP